MIKIIFLLSLISEHTYCDDSNASISQKIGVAESFDYRRPSLPEQLEKWERQRNKVSDELVRRTEVNIQSYKEAVATRDHAVERLREQNNKLQKLESTYTPYEKGQGSKAYEAQNMRSRMAQTLNIIETLNKDVKTTFESARRSATRVEQFAQKSHLAKTTADQMKLMKTPMGRYMMVYVNNPHLPNMMETIRGTSIGKGIESLPNNLSQNGSIKTNSDKTINYRANESILVRNYDGGTVRGTIVGATASGELIIKESLPSGMQQLKQGTYRQVNPKDVSSIHMIRSSSHVSLETMNNAEKFKSIGGRIYNIRPTQVHFISIVESALKPPPALGNPNNQNPINPAKPAIR